MYEPYTRQSLPSKEYRELLGSALCVFSSNNGFIIENIIHTSNAYDWYNLIDLESGKLKKSIADTISRNTGNKDIEGSSNIEMGKKWYENIIFSFIYAIISMKVIY